MILTEDDIARHLAALLSLDPALEPIAAVAGSLPLRHSPAGLRGLAGTIVGQQVSRASAEAIFGRLCERVAIDDPLALNAASDEDFRAAGLSRPKQKTLRAIAAACLSGRLDLARVALADPGDAIAELTALHGIGTWTAECYLLFSAGHPDIFPAGDLALQAAVAHARGLDARPKEKALLAMAAAWSPHRSVAARLFWAYYAAVIRRDTVPVPALPLGEQAPSAGSAVTGRTGRFAVSLPFGKPPSSWRTPDGTAGRLHKGDTIGHHSPRQTDAQSFGEGDCP